MGMTVYREHCTCISLCSLQEVFLTISPLCFPLFTIVSPQWVSCKNSSWCYSIKEGKEDLTTSRPTSQLVV